MHHPRLWPDRSDELLLKAALLGLPDAVDAWRSWQRGRDGKPLDYTQHRLLPLLYHNLKKLGIEDGALEMYRSELRAAWARGQQLRRFAVDQTRALEVVGITSLVLKGVPLAFGYYANPGLRPMADVDILVRPEHAAQATRYFLDRGWECTDHFVTSLEELSDLIPVRHAFNLRDPEQEIEIDLHWSVFRNSLASNEPLWDSAEPLDPDLMTLCSTDQLLHAFAQGAAWNVLRPIRWIPDANAILEKSAIDWDRLVSLAERFTLTQAVEDGLAVLERLVSFRQPEGVRARLRSIRGPFSSRMEYRLSAKRPIPVIGRPLGLGFFGYLRRLWGLSSVGEVFGQGFRHVLDTLRRTS
jgi:hypothetical protein